MQSKLSEVQEDLLRHLSRQTGPVPEDHLDGRVVRALAKRAFVELSRGWVFLKPAGLEALSAHVEHANARRKAAATTSPRHARAEAIRRAVDEVEIAIPRDAEILLNGHPAYADDVLAGLRVYARKLVERFD